LSNEYNGEFQSSVRIGVIGWALMLRQMEGPPLFSANEWTVSAPNKYAAIDNIETFRFVYRDKIS